MLFGETLEILPLDGVADGKDGGEGCDFGGLLVSAVHLREPLLDPVVGALGHAEGALGGGRTGLVGEVGERNGNVGVESLDGVDVLLCGDGLEAGGGEDGDGLVGVSHGGGDCGKPPGTKNGDDGGGHGCEALKRLVVG